MEVDETTVVIVGNFTPFAPFLERVRCANTFEGDDDVAFFVGLHAQFEWNGRECQSLGLRSSEDVLIGRLSQEFGGDDPSMTFTIDAAEK